MDLKVLFILLLYYSMISSVFLIGGSTFSDEGYTTNINLDDSGLSADEIDTGGLFGTGISFGRFVGLVTFGIGLPSDTPTWFALLFGIWQTLVSIFSAGFVLSSIWDG